MNLHLRTRSTSLSSLLALSLTGLPAQDAHAFEIVDALAKGTKASLNLRYRIETVDQDGIDEEALASTLRTRFSFETGRYKQAQVILEADDVSPIGDDDYNSTANGNGDYPVVPDPEGTDLNQAYVLYSGFSGAALKVGRHRINHNDQRFIGGVAWRQNEQTFDGITLEKKMSKALKFEASYIVNVNRIFGPTGGGADLKGDLIFINGDYALDSQNTFNAHYYSLDFESAPNASTTTFGIEFTHKRKFEGEDLTFNAAYMSQSDTGENPSTYDVDYFDINLKYTYQKFWGKVGLEVLGSDEGESFQAPLSTLHIFQGFADKFLNTPGAGLEDFYLTVGGKHEGINWFVTYHDFSADADSTAFGTEIDFQATYELTKRVSLLAKYATYSADEFATDTSKLWLMATFRL